MPVKELLPIVYLHYLDACWQARLKQYRFESTTDVLLMKPKVFCELSGLIILKAQALHRPQRLLAQASRPTLTL